MEVILRGNPEEVAALALAVQGRQQQKVAIKGDTGIKAPEARAELASTIRAGLLDRASEEGGGRGRAVNNINLSQIPTAELAAELSRRDGVEKTAVEVYRDTQIQVNGPAIILVVAD